MSWRSTKKYYKERRVITVTMLPTSEVRSKVTTDYWIWER